MHEKQRRNGFSLVELSIVLVILGLLTGGILGGQSLIKAAELRTVTTDVGNYIAAVNTFRGKYFSLPGDMNNAVRFWGAQAGSLNDGRDNTCASLNQNSPATGKPTCNGNGDGMIGTYDGSASIRKYETFRAWQHLANAGLIAGSYTGVTNGNTPNAIITPSGNAPAAKINNGAYNLTWFGTDPDAGGAGAIYPGNYGNIIVMGKPGGFHAMATDPALTPTDAWGIDTKMDDGNPAKGKVRGRYNTGANCTTSTDEDIAEYRLNTDAIECPIFFLTGF